MRRQQPGAGVEIMSRVLNGTERIRFKLPQRATAGEIAFDIEGFMSMTGQGSQL